MATRAFVLYPQVPILTFDRLRVRVAGSSRSVFYAHTEAEARRGFRALQDRWSAAYPSAVQIIDRDLDSLLRFYRWEPRYWHSLRTTNPIERVNKEFKRRTKAMEISGGELTTYRLLAYR